MKIVNKKGFVLVETLVVTTFIMVIISVVYTNYFPLIAEYNIRESYDDVDGKFSAYWIKEFIVSDYFNLCQKNLSSDMTSINPSYTNSDDITKENRCTGKNLSASEEDQKYNLENKTIKTIIDQHGYYEFKCSSIKNAEYVNECNQIVSALEIKHMYITKYTLAGYDPNEDIVPNDPNNRDAWKNWINKGDPNYVFFKEVAKENTCHQFDTAFTEYVNYLPKYFKRNSTTGIMSAGYRVIIEMYRTNHNNDTTGTYSGVGEDIDPNMEDDYYAFSEMEIPLECNSCGNSTCI